MAFGIETLRLDNCARLGIAPLPGRWGNASGDMAAIRAWAPDIVVSMTEAGEMARHRMADLAGLLARDGIDHAAFPIRDFGTPEVAGDWPALAARLHRILDDGGAVLAHCYGGRGRSGMVLMRLMVERGYPPADALDAIREVRPGAVETAAQQEWGAGRAG